MILFVGSTYIKCENEPEYNKYHNLYYVDGYRWIKSRKSFSGIKLRHNFKHYVKLSDDEAKSLGHYCPKFL